MKRDTGPRWLTPKIRALLGTMPDAELAQRVLASPDAVGRARRKLGIRAHKPGRAWLTPRIRALLGTVADREVASKAHVSVGTVARARRQLGIEGFCGCAPPTLFGARKKR